MIGLDTNVLVRHLVQDDPGMPDPMLWIVFVYYGKWEEQK
jgi:hypothetical protein